MICLGARKDTAQGQIVSEYCLSGRNGTKLLFLPLLVWCTVTQNKRVLVVQPDTEIVPSEHPHADKTSGRAGVVLQTVAQYQW